jgi:hypothetical protein
MRTLAFEILQRTRDRDRQQQMDMIPAYCRSVNNYLMAQGNFPQQLLGTKATFPRPILKIDTSSPTRSTRAARVEVILVNARYAQERT